MSIVYPIHHAKIFDKCLALKRENNITMLTL